MKVKVVGAGLAGAEAAFYLAEHGHKVELYDIKPHAFTPAHKSGDFAELVCSNSLKGNDPYTNACGLLKQEMRELGSLIIEAADAAAVPAGGALAVNRDDFSGYVTKKIKSHPNITVISEEVKTLPDAPAIIATGPLTCAPLAKEIEALTGKALHFYDASAPIVARESIDFTCAFTGDRYGKGGDDYVNCPLNKVEYSAFIYELTHAERALLHDFEKHEIFEGCMPVEVMAARGEDTLRFGPLKPVGLRDKEGNRFYAVLQLRKENAEGSCYNLVGFQTNLKFPEQKRVFSMIPALKNAEFLRYGVMHRNTYLAAPECLNSDFSYRDNPLLFFAGQMTGVEGYVESAASGLMCAIHMHRKLAGKGAIVPDNTTVLGALSAHVATANKDFQPMNANFGILRAAEKTIKDKKERYRFLAARALESVQRYKIRLQEDNG